MPRLSRLMIRTALVWLALGYTVGGLLLLNKGLSMLPWLWTLAPALIVLSLAVVGGLTMRALIERRGRSPRGRL